MICSHKGCPQLVVNQKEQEKEEPLCYFHAKQRDRLIPVEDREYYLSPTDMSTIGNHLTRVKNWSKYALKYRPYVYKTAWKIAKKFNVDRNDLIQEGLMGLWSICSTLDSDKKPAQIVSYIKLTVRGKMLERIANMSEIFKVSMHKYYEDKPKVTRLGMMDQWKVYDQKLNPEEVLLAKEREVETQEKAEEFYGFFKTLTKPERIVLQKLMIAKKPKTTRKVAKLIGVKSPQTVVNVRDNIIQKAITYFQDKED